MIKKIINTGIIMICAVYGTAVYAVTMNSLPPLTINETQFLGDFTLKLGDKYTDAKFITSKGFNYTAVSDLQNALNTCWLYPEKYPDGMVPLGSEIVSTDGKFGRKTEQFVKLFQKEKNLTPDGRVGPRTRAILFAVCNSHNPETYYYAKK